MNCVKCGCELEEGYSRFCPECGTPVENNEPTPASPPVVVNKTLKKSKSNVGFRIVLGILLILSLAWIFFPLVRASGNKITSLSAWDIIAGTKNFDGSKVSAFPMMAIIFVLPQILSAIPLFLKKLSLHKIYASVGIIHLYNAVISICMWILAMNIFSSYTTGIYAYGLGFVINIVSSLLIGFLCISFSASQIADESRNQCWLSVLGLFNTILLCIFFVAVIISAVAIFLISSDLFADTVICTVSILLASASGILAYLKLAKKDFSQWIMLIIHSVLVLVSHIILYFNINILVDIFTGKNDKMDLGGLVAPYINVIVFGIMFYFVLYNTAMILWNYKTLKRRLKK